MEKHNYTKEEISGVSILLDELKRRGVNNLDTFEAKLASYIPQREQFWDIQLEGKTALIFALNTFRATFYPGGLKGADLEVLWQDYRLFVEVSRFREDYDTKAKLEKGEEIGGQELLVPYGRGEKDVEAFHNKIIVEAAQLPRDGIGLVILRSDNCRIEDFEYEQAAEYLEEQVLQNETLKRLSGVLFDSGVVLFSNGNRFYLWRNPQAERCIDNKLCKKLVTLEDSASTPLP
jgi:hypothetical protein